MSTKQTIFALRIVIPLFIAVLSIFVFARVLPESGFVQGHREYRKLQDNGREICGRDNARGGRDIDMGYCK